MRFTKVVRSYNNSRPQYRSGCGRYIVKQCIDNQRFIFADEYAIYESGKYLTRVKDLDQAETAIERAKRIG